MIRYLRLFRIQLRASVLLAMQYRGDFVLDGVLEVLFVAPSIVPLVVVFDQRSSIFGWTFPEALVVVGFFHFLNALVEGAINPSLLAVVEHVRKGTLDFVLLKPADAQFLVSTARFQMWKATNVLSALLIWAFAFHRMGHWPRPLDVLVAVTMLGLSVTILYSLWIITVSTAFYVVRIDNLTYLFDSIFDAARWPSSVFRGVLRIVFTFVIPLGVMTTFPAEALLGRLSLQALGGAAVGAFLAALLARVVFQRALGRYTSAGG